MLFESCGGDPRTGNSLTSPEFTLQSAEKLTFTMFSPQNHNGNRLAVYRTEATKHPAVLLGTYTLDAGDTTNETNSSYSYSEVTYNVCLPAGTYRLVFIASDAENATALTDVFLTGVSCTYSPLSGMLCCYRETARHFRKHPAFSQR